MGERRPPTTRSYTVRQCHSSAHERASQRQARVPISVQRVEQASTIVFQHAALFSEAWLETARQEIQKKDRIGRDTAQGLARARPSTARRWCVHA